MKGISKNLITGGVIVAVLLLLILNTLVTIPAGFRGVVLRFGAVKEVNMGEGLHLKIPLAETVQRMDVRVQKEETESSAASRDLQTITSKIAVNFNVAPEMAAKLYQNVGLNYRVTIIDPAVQEAVKSVTARYTAEELISKRQDVSNEIKSNLSARVVSYGIEVDNFNIVNFEFSKGFNEAIESKQTAEQLALKAQRDLERIRIEAEQKIAQAKAEAEGLKLQREAITPELLQLRAIEKWDGKLPSVTGGALPFIDAAGSIVGGNANK